jgi:D-threonate/D-erythronate kinase
VRHDQRLLILADDFTGACDAAGAFGASRSTSMTWNASGPWPHEVQVLAVDLAQRERSTAEAREAVHAVVRHLRAAEDGARVFVKIDSTLRGPIAGLVRGALEATASAVAVIAPAFPEQGRLLRHGRLVLHGQVGANAAELIGMEGSALIGSSGTGSIEDLERAVEYARGRGIRHVIVDSQDRQDLAVVAEAWTRHDDWLLVGSAGLARHLATPGPPVLPPMDGPLLVVAGTPASATREQLRHLEGDPRVIAFTSAPTDQRDAGQAAAALADAVAYWAADHRPGAVVLTGGATAREVCHRLDAHALRILGEIGPGIPVGSLDGGAWDRVIVVTKAGGFGTPHTLLDVAHALGVSSATGTS